MFYFSNSLHQLTLAMTEERTREELLTGVIAEAIIGESTKEELAAEVVAKAATRAGGEGR